MNSNLDILAQSWRDEIVFRQSKNICPGCGKNKMLKALVCYECKTRKTPRIQRENNLKFCQYYLCPKIGFRFDKNTMVKYTTGFQEFYLCSEECKEGLIKENLPCL